MTASRRGHAGFLASAILLLGLLSGCSSPFGGSSNLNGTIQFGLGMHRVSVHEIDVVQGRSNFHRHQSIAWVAHLKQRAGAKQLDLTITSTTSRRVIVRRPVPISNPSFNEIANPGTPVDGLRRIGLRIPGSYILRYSRGKTVLAQGTFHLLK